MKWLTENTWRLTENTWFKFLAQLLLNLTITTIGSILIFLLVKFGISIMGFSPEGPKQIALAFWTLISTTVFISTMIDQTRV